MREAAWEVPSPPRMVKTLIAVWGGSLFIACAGVAMNVTLSIFTGEVRYFGLALNTVCILVNVAMLRFQVRKLHKEQERIKREEFIRMMFNEWRS